MLDKIKAHSQQETPSLSEFRDDVPHEVEAVLQKMMAKVPADRYQTPAEVAASLSSAATSIQHAKNEKKDRQAGSSSPRRRRPLVVTAVATLLLFAIVSAAVFFVRMGQTTIRFDVVDESLAIRFGGQRISIDNDGQTIHITPGKNTFVVERDGLEIETATFTLKKGPKSAFAGTIMAGSTRFRDDRSKSTNRTAQRDQPQSERHGRRTSAQGARRGRRWVEGRCAAIRSHPVSRPSGGSRGDFRTMRRTRATRQAAVTRQAKPVGREC